MSRSETAEAAITVVATAIGRHGAPARFLTDNGTAFNQSRRGNTSQLEVYLRRQGVSPITGRPSKPTTQGKNERLHQTIQKFLDVHRPIRTQARLVELVDEFDDYYNTQRAHQSLDHPDQTPAEAYQAKPKAVPGPPQPQVAPPAVRPSTTTPTRKVASGIARRMMGEQSSDAPATARRADRRVSSNGRIHICPAKIYVSTQLAGQTLHVIFDATTIEIFDTDGVFLGSVPHPGKIPPGAFKLLTIQRWQPSTSETQPSTTK